MIEGYEKRRLQDKRREEKAREGNKI